MITTNVALVGFMAAGKSTIGRALAERLGHTLLDTDDLIVEAAGRAIPAIFADEGEAGFRARERAAVADAAGRQRVVIACGGGVARDPANVDALRRGCLVVLLHVGAETAAQRIWAAGPGRPMIDDHVGERTFESVLGRVRELLAEREPFYRQAAEAVVDVDGLGVDAVVDAIVERLAAEEMR